MTNRDTLLTIQIWQSCLFQGGNMFFKMIITIALIFVTVSNILAASPNDVQKVVEYVRHGHSDGLQRRYDRKTKKTKITFMVKTRRYYIEFNEPIWAPYSCSSPVKLVIWYRDNLGLHTIFQDAHIDGTVDEYSLIVGHSKKSHKLDCRENGGGADQDWGTFSDKKRQEYDQVDYDRTIADTLAFFANKP